MHDEINTLQLELSQIEERNQNLTKDNAKLLQRWLDAKQAEVNRMNEANDFYEDMQSRRQAVMNWQAGQSGDESSDAPAANSTGSGNGVENKETGDTTTKDGTPSHGETDVNLTPNG